MTQRIIGRTGSRRRRRTLLLPLLAIFTVGLLYIGGASAQGTLNRDLFELDGDATNDVAYTKAGVLNAAVATAADGATTSIQICQSAATFANGTIVLVDAERMSLSNGSAAAGGGCPGDFPNKRNYDALRGAGTTVPGAHAKAEDVSLLTFANGTPMPGDDWDDVYGLIGDPPDLAEKCESLGAVECAFTTDGRAMSVFTQSKDYDEVSDDAGATNFWKWRNQSVPDADELDDGFAIKYVNEDGEQHLYFGADRFATNGTKDAGFWFFHQTIGTEEAASGDSTFTGLHTPPDPGDNGVFCKQADGGSVPDGQPSPVPACTYDDDDTGGDILVLTTFTGGGAVTSIRVFEWVGPAGSTAALLERGVQGDCVPGDDDQQLCATVNDTTVETAWPYSGKSEPATKQVASGGLLEGGLNLTALGLEGCFSSFMATTRSSASLTADPKDFILGSFEACGVGITTTPTNEDDEGTDEIVLGESVYDHAVVQGTGGGPDPTGTVTFFICAPDELDEPDDGNATTPDDDPATCDVGGTPVPDTDPVTPVSLDGGIDTSDARATADSALFEPDAVGTWCWRGEYSGDDIYGAATDASLGECFDVIDTSSIVTDQAWVPNDTATVTSTGGSNLTGTLTLTLYDNATCTPGEEDENVLYQEVFTDISDEASPVSRTTTNGDGNGTGLAADAIFQEADSPVGPLSWQAVFDGTPDSTDSTSPCETTTQFTIDDNDPTP